MAFDKMGLFCCRLKRKKLQQTKASRYPVVGVAAPLVDRLCVVACLSTGRPSAGPGTLCAHLPVVAPVVEVSLTRFSCRKFLPLRSRARLPKTSLLPDLELFKNKKLNA